MGADTKIQWADDTANFWFGCTQVSPACDHCYAKTLGDRFGVVWNGPPVKLKSGVSNLRKFNARAKREGRKRFVFINSLSDTFDNQADPVWRAELFDAIAECEHIIALVLTKRIGNVEHMGAREAHPWPRNAWLGITVCNQEEADRDIPKLMRAQVMLGVRRTFLSVEPMLGPVDILTALQWRYWQVDDLSLAKPCSIDWVICGGESGKDARPMHPEWATHLEAQCRGEGVPFHFKQWGEWGPPEAVCQHSGPDRPGIMRIQRDLARGPYPADRYVTLEGGVEMVRLGKHLTGRWLNGALHNGRPQP
jgi:protein gp37